MRPPLIQQIKEEFPDSRVAEGLLYLADFPMPLFLLNVFPDALWGRAIPEGWLIWKVDTFIWLIALVTQRGIARFYVSAADPYLAALGAL